MQLQERRGIHASSFAQFAQSLGYNGFKDLQTLFQKRLEAAVPGFEARVRALESYLEDRDDPTDYGFLQDLVVKDCLRHGRIAPFRNQRFTEAV